MSDRLEGVLLAAGISIAAIVYMGCGAILAQIIGIQETALAWWAMLFAWPMVLFIFAIILWAILAIAYGILSVLASGVSRR